VAPPPSPPAVPVTTRPTFTKNSLQILRELIEAKPAGNRWCKVNLHVHGQGSDPAEIVRQARAAEIDLLAITDHQSFSCCDAVIAASKTDGRSLVVLPGIEITAHEGVHLLCIFPQTFDSNARTFLLGWLEIPGDGKTHVASKRVVGDIFDKVDDLGGIIVVPHPYSAGIGLLDGARKMSTKEDWLASGHVRLVQMPDDAVRHVGHDSNGNWINRYVLASCQERHIEASTYCLAPFNRSDAHKAEEVKDGCSWFRMHELSVEGLKQVGCEPKTRIARIAPAAATHDCILGVRISGGYCDDQFFRFNEGLNCLVGDNHSGKSAVLDFIRFGLSHDMTIAADARERLLTRLYGILGEGGAVEVFVRQEGKHFVAKRTFQGVTKSRGAEIIVERCTQASVVYLYEQDSGLLPTVDHRFLIEVYEQGRIGRLREDIERQLDMLDEFAELTNHKQRRASLSRNLTENAVVLKPLYEERDSLKTSIGGLDTLEEELAEKERLLPNTEEQKRWADATAVVSDLGTILTELRDAIGRCPDPASTAVRLREPTDLDKIFGHRLPEIDLTHAAQSEALIRWREVVKTALRKIEDARQTIVTAIGQLVVEAKPLREQWDRALTESQREVREQLAKAGIESPQEVIKRVAWLRSHVNKIKGTNTPRLFEVQLLIDAKEEERNGLLERLEELDREIKEKREAKARELTERLGADLRISLTPCEDKKEYRSVLLQICSEITSQSTKIVNRDTHIQAITNKLTPLQLARSLQQNGQVVREDGTAISLHKLCGITEHTQTVLCGIGTNIELINRIQIITAADVPQIFVRRRRESNFAPLRTGLSQGEQSAAILTLALETRNRPLILDQPEDELGYGYVVHLIVPKILKAKFTRQLILVTHEANIPVLGDADYVIKMENLPKEPAGRCCVPAVVGCFESPPVTAALLDLEGGQQAFHFRERRYALPKIHSGIKIRANLT
jgi:ABC-type cobalamin/Fe3+-siderophores transport system ATPase subunit